MEQLSYWKERPQKRTVGLETALHPEIGNSTFISSNKKGMEKGQGALFNRIHMKGDSYMTSALKGREVCSGNASVVRKVAWIYRVNNLQYLDSGEGSQNCKNVQTSY